MENVRGFEDDRGSAGAYDHDDHGDDAIGVPAETAPVVDADERRMHVRAYNLWVSLLAGKPFPSIAALEPAGIAGFGAHSVLLDFTDGSDDPAIAYLGGALRAECGIDGRVTRIGQVPGRSLLSRLTDHHCQIIANRAPVGFEAEFVGTRGNTMLYRGILMPFSSNGRDIDYIYGVINWKERIDAAAQTELDAELQTALTAAPPAASPPAPAWADGPGAVDTATTAATERPLEHRPALATVQLPVAATEGYVLLLGRVVDGGIAIVADVTAPEPLAEAIRRAA